jgi:hypothetical protein
MSKFDFSSVDIMLHEACEKDINTIPCEHLFEILNTAKHNVSRTNHKDVDKIASRIVRDSISKWHLEIAANENWRFNLPREIQKNFIDYINHYTKI